MSLLPGKWAICASGAIAAVVLLAFAVYLMPSGRGTACEYPDGLFADTPSSTPTGGAPVRSTDSGPLRLFPPGRTCRGYAVTYHETGDSSFELIAEKTYPNPTAYLWGFLCILFPLAVSVVWRGLQLRIHRQV